MYNHKIALKNPKLYVYWAFFFEKYKREFEATAVVLGEGLKQVDENDGKLILEQFKRFGDRMQERNSRDVRDELGPLAPAFIAQSDLSNSKANNSKKRTRQQAFGFESEDIPSGKKLKLMESSEVKTCNDQVEKYQKGIEVVIQAKADQGKRYEELKPAEVTIAELEKRPLSWLSRQKQEDEFAQAELEALQTPVV